MGRRSVRLLHKGVREGSDAEIGIRQHVGPRGVGGSLPHHPEVHDTAWREQHFRTARARRPRVAHGRGSASRAPCATTRVPVTGKRGGHEVRAALETSEDVAAGGIGGGRSLAGVLLAVVVGVEVDLAIGQPAFVGVQDAVAIPVAEEPAVDLAQRVDGDRLGVRVVALVGFGDCISRVDHELDRMGPCGPRAQVQVHHVRVRSAIQSRRVRSCTKYSVNPELAGEGVTRRCRAVVDHRPTEIKCVGRIKNVVERSARPIGNHDLVRPGARLVGRQIRLPGARIDRDVQRVAVVAFVALGVGAGGVHHDLERVVAGGETAQVVVVLACVVIGLEGPVAVPTRP